MNRGCEINTSPPREGCLRAGGFPFRQLNAASIVMNNKTITSPSQEELNLDVSLALDALRAGGTILYPTDTIWGIGCDANNADAVADVYKLKHRALTKSLIVLVADTQMLTQYVGDSAALAAKEYACAVRPTTVIFPSALRLAQGVAAPDGSVAIRIALHPFCQALCKALGGAIVSTSANISGHTHLAKGLESVEQEIREGVTHIVNAREDTAKGTTASRIVRLRTDGNIEIVRP